MCQKQRICHPDQSGLSNPPCELCSVGFTLCLLQVSELVIPYAMSSHVDVRQAALLASSRHLTPQMNLDVPLRHTWCCERCETTCFPKTLLYGAVACVLLSRIWMCSDVTRLLSQSTTVWCCGMCSTIYLPKNFHVCEIVRSLIQKTLTSSVATGTSSCNSGHSQLHQNIRAPIIAQATQEPRGTQHRTARCKHRDAAGYGMCVQCVCECPSENVHSVTQNVLHRHVAGHEMCLQHACAQTLGHVPIATHFHST